MGFPTIQLCSYNGRGLIIKTSIRRLTPKVPAGTSSATSVVNWRLPEQPLKVVTGATVLAAYRSPITRKFTCGPWKAPVSPVLALPGLLVSTSVSVQLDTQSRVDEQGTICFRKQRAQLARNHLSLVPAVFLRGSIPLQSIVAYRVPDSFV